MTFSRSSQRGSAWRGIDWLGLVLILIALVSQAVLQSHVHERSATTVLAAQALQASGKHASIYGNGTAAQEDCALCRELGMGGGWLGPVTFTFAIPVCALCRSLAVFVESSAPLRSSHGWQSRAPPSPLHA